MAAKKKVTKKSVQKKTQATKKKPSRVSVESTFKSKPRKVTVKKQPEVKPEEPKVFCDRSRRIFLALGSNRFLTLRDEQVQVVKLDNGLAPRDKDGHQHPDTTCTGDLIPMPDYDLKLATQKFYDCYLPRSFDAAREMCIILGKPVPEIPEAVKVARRAAGERLKANRPPRIGYTLQQLCEQLKIDPRDARKALRKGNFEKPEAGWVWPTQKEAEAVARNAGFMK